MTELEQYCQDAQQVVLARAEMSGVETFVEDAFVQYSLEQLGTAGELDDATVCLHRSKSLGLQVSGYAVSEDGESLDLIVAIHTNEVPARTILKSEMTDSFRRVAKFFDQCTRGYFKSIEEATDAFDLAQLIHSCWKHFTRVRFILITDGICRSDPPALKALEGLHASYDIWDAERFFRNWSSGREREEIAIDFVDLIGESVPCLALDNTESGYTTLLSIFPGKLLVELYGRFGPRLLERNVRSFLQVKGGVNKGIRDTIRGEPDMFLAYNNGLSCTAAEVLLEKDEGGFSRIRHIRDLQIVNGGQTTASIYHASMKEKADVSRIGVQVKLTILDDITRMDEVVPLISKYANSQNAVKTADLMANDKYHRRVEELSRTVWAPPRDGALRQTRWFYERARGQYRDDIARERTPARKKDFETTNPKEQMFTKTDLAKYILTWDQKPHQVSKGAQFAFSAFTVGMEVHIGAEAPLDQSYFERLIAKAILFRETERIVKQAKYPGYRANIVTYSIGKLVFVAKGRIELGRIWREQKIYPELEAALEKLAAACYDHIVSGAAGGNVTQFCKREECWTSFRDRYVSIPDKTVRSFEDARQTKERPDDDKVNVVGRGPDPLVGEAIKIGSLCWIKLASFATEERLFSPKQIEILTSVGLTIGEGRPPARKSAEIAIALLKTAEGHGFERAPTD